ncbi:MAG: hypothetical protein BZ138_00015 [Methanosphaera sp. rholeuAM270]|nr:MAG: hypothetical protein BZ138_00015 [Methanosphaera sp. rholeuAM270]
MITEKSESENKEEYPMIYVTDNFSMQMFEHRSYQVKTKKIKKSKLLQNTKEAVTSIGSRKIAGLLNKKVGKSKITLKSGDVIYVVTSKFGRNKTDYRKENDYRYQMFNIE